MKVLLVGNRGNTNFRIAQWLRAKGIEANLLLEKGLEHERSKPEWEDPSLAEGYPQWIGEFKFNTLHYFFTPSEVKRIKNKYDVLISSGHYITSLAHLDMPVILKPNGDDISTMPFMTGSLKKEIISYLYRSRISKVSRIWLSQEDCIWAVKLMGVENKLFNYPMLVDLNKMKDNINNELIYAAKKKYQNYDIVMFNPSRKNIGNHRDYKGNEKFLKAAKVIIEKYPKKSFRLVLGMHGKDVEEFRDLINELELMDKCDLIDHLNLPDLHALMNLENVLLYDQFGDLAHWNLGGIAREGLANNCTILTSTLKDNDRFKKVYGEDCPIFTATSVQEIIDQTVTIIKNNYHLKFRNEKRGEEWIKNNLDWNTRINGVIEMLHEAVNEYQYLS